MHIFENEANANEIFKMHFVCLLGFEMRHLTQIKWLFGKGVHRHLSVYSTTPNKETNAIRNIKLKQITNIPWLNINRSDDKQTTIKSMK